MSKALSLEVVPAKPVKVPALLTGDDAEVKQRFGELFDQAQNGLRTIVTFGIYALETKLRRLKHGQFGDWVKGNYGESAYRSVRYHMQLTESTLEACGIKKLKPIFQNGSTLPISKHNDFLLLPEAKVPEALKPLREKICAIVDGKSARALFTELKQAEEPDDDDKPLKAKRGRLKGQGGATKEQRAKAAEREEQERITALKLEAEDFAAWADKHGDDKGIGSFRGSKEWNKLKEAVEYLAGYMRKADAAATKGDAQ